MIIDRGAAQKVSSMTACIQKNKEKCQKQTMLSHQDREEKKY
jgi:hypothetical protein